MNKILVVIDMQNDFIDGSLGTKEASNIVLNVVNKINNAKKDNKQIFFTKDIHSDNYLSTQEGQFLPIPHCIVGTSGCEIHSALDKKGATILSKSTFGFTNWKGYISPDWEEIEIVGVCTDICVITNALIIKTLFPDTKITVDAACCAGTTPKKHQSALEIMKSCQINIINEEKEWFSI